MKRPTVPHDEYAETAVLGGVSIWSVNAEQVFNTLTSADFYSPRNQRWFLALHTLYSRGDTITVTTEFSGLVSENKSLDYKVKAVSELAAWTGARRDR